MDIILERASQYVKYNFDDYIPNHKKTLEEINDELDQIDENFDKIKFINVILKANNETLEKHKLSCTNADCTQDFEYGNILYFLNQELKRIGVNIQEDTITEAEKSYADSKINQILKDLSDLKAGQEVIYEDLLNELNDLKDLYFLGKKRWHQLFIGKCVDMAASGVVSETISKQIIEDFSKNFPSLIS